MLSISKNRLDSVLANFKQKKILVVGDIMIDEYLIGNVARISPEAPVPVVEIEDQMVKFGGAANVAANVLSLGCEPLIVGTIGDDLMGDAFEKLMLEKNIKLDGIIRLEDRPTTVKTRIIGQTQHIVRVDREVKTYLDKKHESLLIDKIVCLAEKADAIILQDYNKGVLSEKTIKMATKVAKNKQILIAVDPKFLNFLKYKDVSVFKPNIKETEEALALKIENDRDLMIAGKKLCELLTAECVLITKGAAGMSLFEANGQVTHVSTKAREISDVSGAGDTVISTMTTALVGGANYKEAATLANYAAGIVCEEVGIIPINLDKLYKVCVGENIQ